MNYGPNPSEVVDFVRQNAAVVVRGIHDHAVGTGRDPKCSPAFREMAHAMQTYTVSVLSDDQQAYLRRLPSSAQMVVDGRRFFLCHAAPSDPLLKYGPTEAAFWTPEAVAVTVDILLVVHTHLPFVMDIGETRVVNPGSVGQQKHGAPEACYAVWEEGAIALKTCRYPVAETVRKVFALPIEMRIRKELASVLETGAAPC